MSAERGVAVLRRTRVRPGADHEFMPAVDGLGRSNVGYDETELYTAFPEAYAAALVDVAEAARAYNDTLKRSNVANGTDLRIALAALDRLDAAKATP